MVIVTLLLCVQKAVMPIFDKDPLKSFYSRSEKPITFKLHNVELRTPLSYSSPPKAEGYNFDHGRPSMRPSRGITKERLKGIS